MAQSDMRGQEAAVRERTGGAVRASWMAALRDPRHVKGLAIAVAAGVFMASVGAFGTGEAPVAVRYLYWITVMLAGASGGVLVSILVDLGGWFDDRPVLQ